MLLAPVALLGLGAVSCADDSGRADPHRPAFAETTGPEIRATRHRRDGCVPSLLATLTDDEIAGLLWMREEEQLAHDVYTTLGDLWGLRIFENISAAETTHVAAVVDLLDRYGIGDPAAGNEHGTFTDPQIQALYDQLVTDGSVSLLAALSVGALIEELDISDLRLRSSATDVVDITTVYANLEKGSRNHLRAFTSELADRDVIYEPTQLDLDAYEAIVSSPMERGRGA